MPNIKRFTLAEVLITLTIVGIIASMTIPSLTIGHQKQVYVHKLKKTYTTLSNAYKKLVFDNSGNLQYSNHNNFRDNFTPYLNHIKTCDLKASAGACWAEDTYVPDVAPPEVNHATIVLSDGSSVTFWAQGLSGGSFTDGTQY